MTKKDNAKIKTYKKDDPTLRKVLVSINKNTCKIIEEEALAQERPITNYIEILVKAIFEGLSVMDVDALIEKHRWRRFKNTAENADLSKTTCEDSEEYEDLEDEVDEILKELKRSKKLPN